ncbi:MAG: radical SAM protein [Clostridia bacterium]|nr:radical SAM protein [Clostridia bacterium]
MGQSFDLQEYLTNGAEQIVRDALRATRDNPRQSAFFAKFAVSGLKAAARRRSAEKEGRHVPSYLICSITSSCNLHCTGCYSRCASATCDSEPVRQLSGADWQRVFDQAEELGISFILLAGGEPLLRRDVIRAASERPGILFPVFTNGSFMDDECFELFDRHRNLIPVMSLEGGRAETDARRGEGVYDRIASNMRELQNRGVIFGASITVTARNLELVTSEEFVDDLARNGCRAVFYIEYVPVAADTADLAPTGAQRNLLESRVAGYRENRGDLLMLAFPGDEKSAGGCLAAGRGFFHINSHGGAEPCPFSPYSDVSVLETSLREAIASPLFRALDREGYLLEEHVGGCVLHDKRERVEALLASLGTAPR